VNWGHIQFVAGAFVTMAGVFNPGVFPEIPMWVFGVVGIVAAGVTYWLRSVTTKPLNKK